MKGFSLIELLVVMGIVAIFAGVMITALNPVGILLKGRNSRRTADVNTLMNAVKERMADYLGVYSCSIGPLPTSATVMASAGGYNIAPCIYPDYIPSIPFDPSTGTYASTSSYNTGYTIVQNASSGLVTISAPDTEPKASATVPVSVTR